MVPRCIIVAGPDGGKSLHSCKASARQNERTFFGSEFLHAFNVYGMQMARSTFEGVKKLAPEKRRACHLHSVNVVIAAVRIAQAVTHVRRIVGKRFFRE